MSGFQHAPVSLGLMVVPPVASLAVSLLGLKPWVPLVWSPHLTQHLQLYRVLASCLVALDSSTLLFYLLLVYHTSRHAERLLGSRKFASYILLVIGVERLLSVLVLAALHGSTGLNKLEAGPWVLVAAVIGQWWKCTPGLYTFRIFGAEVGDKIYPFMLAAVMAFSAPLPALVSALATHLVLAHPLSSSYILPASLSRTANRFLQPLLPPAPPPQRSTEAWPERDAEDDLRQRTAVAGLRRRIAASATAAAAPAPALPMTAAPSPTGGESNAQGRQQWAAQWVSVLSGGRGTAGREGQQPSEEDIAGMSTLFPDVTRARIIRALTESDLDRERAAESLLADAS